jgi:putative ABC transport system ATP-binding protein
MQNTAARNNKGYPVSVEGLTYSPSPDVAPVLNNIKLEIKGGEFVSVIGPNGAGKSSLLAAIAGELPGIEGRITIHAEPVDKPVNRVIDGVGVVHQQDKLDLIGHLSIAQNIFIRQLLGGGSKNRIMGVCETWCTDIAARLHKHAPNLRRPHNTLVKYLAGGERQMLSTAIAIHFEHEQNPCALLLLDEHTAHLDAQNGKEVMDYTAAQITETGCTAIMVTHRRQDALDHSDKIIVLEKGRLLGKIDNPKSLTIHSLETEIHKFREEQKRMTQ